MVVMAGRLALGFVVVAAQGLAVSSRAAPTPDPKEAAAAVRESELRSAIERLVGFGTRHTLSDTTSPTRGVGAARRWVKSRFETASEACGGCLEIMTPGQVFTGERVPAPTRVEDVLAVQKGVGDPTRVIIISGHVDSRINDVLDAVTDAPGANDDGSGAAAVLEAARVLSKHRFPATLVYAVLSGEEQGLLGGQVLANVAKARGWKVEAVLNNDIIGNSHGQDGAVVDHVVRVFSEGVRANETTAGAAERRKIGGELDAPSRQIARYLKTLARSCTPDLEVRTVYRADRFSRGGDQAPMQEAGFPAVRVTEGDENYARQHQRIRTEAGNAFGDTIDGVDFPYLTRVVRLNVAALAALALAPPPPDAVKVTGAVSADTTLTWTPANGAAGYKVYWRETTDPEWRFSRPAGPATSITLKGVNIDNYSFGVAAVSPDGLESPVEFPGAPGAFFPAQAEPRVKTP